jgi:deoxyribose-phosphate aldolase
MNYPKETLREDGLDPRVLVKYIEHTVLYPDTKKEKVRSLCAEAKENGFSGVCINPVHVAFAASELKGTGIDVCAVIGFPLGATTPAVKAFEAAEAVKNGATGLDMVINIGAVKDGNWELVEKDICGVVEAAAGKAHVKVIIETCLLTDEEKVKASEAAKKAGAQFVKTSTGMSTGGATEHDVALIKKTVGEDMGVKASGGVRSSSLIVKMINAGASKIGTGSYMKTLNALKGKNGES